MFAQRKNSIIMVQLLVVMMLLFGRAEAKAIETGLWGIGWDVDAKQVKQNLEGQGFEFMGQGKDADDRQWQKFGNGLFSGFHCNVQTIWQSKQLAEINIESTGKFLLGAEFTYRNLVTRFTDEYGQPTEQDKYMLKMFPGIWVETMKWTVPINGVPAFEVIAVQNNPANVLGIESMDLSRISITFKHIGGNRLLPNVALVEEDLSSIIGTVPACLDPQMIFSAAMLEQGEEYSKNLQIVEASSIYQTLLNSTDSYQFFTQTAQEYLAAYSSLEEAVDYLAEDSGFTFYGFKNIVTDSSGQQWVRIDLSTAAQAELQKQNPMDMESQNELANMRAVLCRVRVIPATGTYAVVEQIWLDGSNQIIGGRPAWTPQDAGWPAPYIKQACETFLQNWFTSRSSIGTVNQ